MLYYLDALILPISFFVMANGNKILDSLWLQVGIWMKRTTANDVILECKPPAKFVFKETPAIKSVLRWFANRGVLLGKWALKLCFEKMGHQVRFLEM